MPDARWMDGQGGGMLMLHLISRLAQHGGTQSIEKSRMDIVYVHVHLDVHVHVHADGKSMRGVQCCNGANIEYRMSCFVFRVSYSYFLVSCFLFLVSGFLFLVEC